MINKTFVFVVLASITIIFLAASFMATGDGVGGYGIMSFVAFISTLIYGGDKS